MCSSDLNHSTTSAIQVLLRQAATDGQLPIPDALQLEETLQELQHWGEGGFHDVWKVKFKPSPFDSWDPEKFPNDMPHEIIVRVQKRDTVTDPTPIWVRQEVGIRNFITNNLDVPVPRIYAWDDEEQLGFPFTAEEFVDGVPLDSVWHHFDEQQKTKVLSNLAHVLVNLAKARFSQIGSLDPRIHGIVPHLEQSMDGTRIQVYDPELWNVGPYKSTKEYVLAMYEKEIAFNESGLEAASWSEEYEQHYGSPATFARYLRHIKAKLENEEPELLDDGEEFDPFIISHGDLAGRNILVDGTEIVALVDFEFAAILPANQFFRRTSPESMPLELYANPPPLPEGSNSDTVNEWYDATTRARLDNEAVMEQLQGLMIAEAEQRGWSEEIIDHLLRGSGSAQASKVQWNMAPWLEPEYNKDDYEDIAGVLDPESTFAVEDDKALENNAVEDHGHQAIDTNTETPYSDVRLPEPESPLANEDEEAGGDDAPEYEIHQGIDMSTDVISNHLRLPDPEPGNTFPSTPPPATNGYPANDATIELMETPDAQKRREKKSKQNKRKKEAKKRKKALATANSSPQSDTISTLSLRQHEWRYDTFQVLICL